MKEEHFEQIIPFASVARDFKLIEDSGQRRFLIGKEARAARIGEAIACRRAVKKTVKGNWPLQYSDL